MGQEKRHSAWAYVPTLYFAEGLPNVVVTSVAVVFFKNLGVPNDKLALWTSLIAFPWTLKMFWGPVVGAISKRRNWIIGTQLFLIILFLALALAIRSENFLISSLIVLTLIALASATHDIAADGFYIIALNNEDQAKFVGWRSTAYRLAMIFGSGFLVYVSGTFYKTQHSWPIAWQNTLLLTAAVFAAITAWNLLNFPKPQSDVSSKLDLSEFFLGLSSFFKQEHLILTLSFVFFYRFPESMIGKLSTPFFLDTRIAGGLELSNESVGILSGAFGVAALLSGGILGGWLISKFGLRKCLWPMVLSMNIPNLFYLVASIARPDQAQVAVLIVIDQFGYGFGFSAYMVYLMEISRRTAYATACYSVATGLMALSALVAGAASGYFFESLKSLTASNPYLAFFVLVCVLGIPGTIVARQVVKRIL